MAEKNLGRASFLGIEKFLQRNVYSTKLILLNSLDIRKAIGSDGNRTDKDWAHGLVIE